MVSISSPFFFFCLGSRLACITMRVTSLHIFLLFFWTSGPSDFGPKTIRNFSLFPTLPGDYIPPIPLMPAHLDLSASPFFFFTPLCALLRPLCGSAEKAQAFFFQVFPSAKSCRRSHLWSCLPFPPAPSFPLRLLVVSPFVFGYTTFREPTFDERTPCFFFFGPFVELPLPIPCISSTADVAMDFGFRRGFVFSSIFWPLASGSVSVRWLGSFRNPFFPVCAFGFLVGLSKGEVIDFLFGGCFFHKSADFFARASPQLPLQDLIAALMHPLDIGKPHFDPLSVPSTIFAFGQSLSALPLHFLFYFAIGFYRIIHRFQRPYVSLLTEFFPYTVFWFSTFPTQSHGSRTSSVPCFKKLPLFRFSTFQKYLCFPPPHSHWRFFGSSGSYYFENIPPFICYPHFFYPSISLSGNMGEAIFFLSPLPSPSFFFFELPRFLLFGSSKSRSLRRPLRFQIFLCETSSFFAAL